MKVKLKNFRCHTDGEYDFGDTGLVLLSGTSGKGKCLGKNTPVLLYDGTTKYVQDITVGDTLMGDDNQPKNVLTTTSGYDYLYKIIPKKGKPYIINSQHILTLKVTPPQLYFKNQYWTVFFSHQGIYQNRKFTNRQDAVLFLHDLNFVDTIDIPLGEYLKLNTASKKRLHTYHQGINLHDTKEREKYLYYLTTDCGTCTRNKIILRVNKDWEDIEHTILSLGYMCCRKGDDIIFYKDRRKVCQKFKVESIGVGEYYGFQIQGKRQRFLLGDFTVTHNSSILHAINFALYGSGTKVVSYGKTSCKVELDIKNYNIIRTKRPNRVVLKNLTSGEELEDDSAQALINKVFGNAFETTSYIQQDNSKSFIMMSPLEKLEFLEKFAFQDIDLTKLKTTCKNMIKQRHDDLISATSQLELAISFLQNSVAPEEVKFPLKINSEKSIQNEYTRHQNTQTLLRRALRTQNTLQQELSDLSVLLAKITSNEKYTNNILLKLEKLNLELSHIQYDQHTFEKYQKELDTIISMREFIKYKQDEQKLFELQTLELDNARTQLTNIENVLWKDHNQSELNQLLRDNKQVLDDLNKIHQYQKEILTYQTDENSIKNIQDEINKIIKHLTKLRSEKTYNCPTCDTLLSLLDDKLVTVENDTDIQGINNEISKVSQILTKLETKLKEEELQLKRKSILIQKKTELENQYEELPLFEDIQNDTDYMLEYKQKQEDLERKKQEYTKIIEKRLFSSSLQTMEKSLQKKKHSIPDTFPPNLEVDENYETKIRNTLDHHKHEKLKKINLEQQVKELTNELEKLKKDLYLENKLYTEKYEKIKDKDELDLEKSNLENTIKDLENNNKIHEQNIKEIERYKQYQTELIKYNDLKTKVDKLRVTESDAKDKYSAITILKEKITESESIAMAQIIESINIHAQEYLDLFFPENPIVVRLQPFKESKNGTKSQINIHIDYKGMDADLSMLSGGETSRVVLAYTLALSEIFNSEIILLDECTASLDQDMNSTVIEGIRKHFSNKLVIVIAHQVVSGVFDRHYEL